MRAQEGTAADSTLSNPPAPSQAQPTLATGTRSESGKLAPKILIYERLLSFLKDACTIWTLGRSLGDVARLQTVLDGYLLSMASDSVVGGIIASVGHRKTLLELCSKLGLDDDPRLRAALRADEERIATFIASILESKSTQEAVLKLEGDPAQSLLDVIQEALNRGFLMAPEHSRQARRIIRKLSESCDGLPSSLFITGVTGREEHPTFAGGFGDIYRATYGDKTVAVKHMRHFIQSSEIRDIRLKLCREALVWKELKHPSILPFLGIDQNSFPSSLCIISPWMEHGTILNYLKDHGRANVDKLLYEIAQGLQYLHSHNIVHGDLRGANILITEDWSACLADFGLSVFANATTTMHTSTRAGSIHWMAPELIDPERFGCKFARTPASDVYAFGCVCMELYTGLPPFSELSQPAALLRVVNGERPKRPPCSPPMSDVLWFHVREYWAEDPAARPRTEVVVEQMIWPSPHPKPKTLRPLPPIPVPRAPPSASPSEPPYSPPLYVSPQGSPPGYDPADYQRVELTPFKLAQMEKARQQGPSRELDLGHIMKLIGKASDRTLRDQTVLLPEGIKTMLEMARRRDITKRDAFVKQLAEYSDLGRLHSQDFVLSPQRRNPEPLDPDEIITLPQFVKETPPPEVPDDPLPISRSLPNPNKILIRPRRPSLPWLRISPSLTTLKYQLTSSKTSIPESATPAGDTARNIVSAGPKISSPLHRRLRSNSGASKNHVRGQSAQGVELKSPVRERVKDILAAAASASGSKTDAALRGLWRRVMPPVIDTEEASVRSNSSFSIGRPSEFHGDEDDDEIPTGPIDRCEPADECDPPEESDLVLDEPERPPDIDPQLPDNNQKPDTENVPHHVPPDEDMWLLFECRIGAGNASLLSEGLAMTPPQALNNPELRELRRKCMESQGILLAQTPWASARAERSRVAKYQGDSQNTSTMLTWEEELLSEMLAANEALFGALKLYDDLVPIEPERPQQIAEEMMSTPGSSSSRRHPMSLPAPGISPTQTSPLAGTPHGLVGEACHPFKVKALKAFTADPDDPDEISFNKDEILDMVEKQVNWCLVQNADGEMGIAPSDYFSALDTDDRQTENLPNRSSGGTSVYLDGTAESGRSFSQEEIFEVAEKQLQWWKVPKPQDSSGALSSDFSSFDPETFRCKAQALYPYTADTDDPRELSFKQGEILDIGDRRADWWPARNAKGLVGIAPSNYLQLLQV